MEIDPSQSCNKNIFESKWLLRAKYRFTVLWILEYKLGEQKEETLQLNNLEQILSENHILEKIQDSFNIKQCKINIIDHNITQ